MKTTSEIIGEELDRQAMRDRARGPEPEREQGYHEDTVLHQQQDDADEVLRQRADWTCGDLEHILYKHDNPLLTDVLRYVRMVRRDIKNRKVKA